METAGAPSLLCLALDFLNFLRGMETLGHAVLLHERGVLPKLP